jgi:hypothetical protein
LIDELKSLFEAHTNKHVELQHKIKDIDAFIAAIPKLKEVIVGLISGQMMFFGVLDLLLEMTKRHLTAK